MMKRIALVALLVAALVGVPASSWAAWHDAGGGTGSFAARSCYGGGSHASNLCLGTDAHGVGYIFFGNASGGVYFYVDPLAVLDTASSVSKKVFRYAHQYDVQRGLTDRDVGYGNWYLSEAHGVSMSIAHECTNLGCKQ